MKENTKIPAYYAAFIVVALLPQIFRFNGTILDDLVKIGAMLFLCANLLSVSRLRYVDHYAMIYLFAFFVSALFTHVNGDDTLPVTIINLLSGIMLFYLFYVVPKKIRCIDEANVLLFYEIFSNFMLLACAYNMITHFNSLLHITSLSVYSAVGISSFFDNKNTFGAFLMFAVLASSILYIRTKSKKWLFYDILFLVNEMMALCRTAIVISAMLLVLLMLAPSEHRKIRVIMLVFAGLLASVIILNSSAFWNYLHNNVFGSTVSLDSRERYIVNMLPLVKGKYALWGYGYEQSAKLAARFTGNRYFHNTYLKIVIIGGLTKLVLYLYVLSASLYYGIRVWLKDHTLGRLCLLSSLTYIVYSFVEALILFDTPVTALLATIMTISCPIFFYKSLKNQT